MRADQNGKVASAQQMLDAISESVRTELLKQVEIGLPVAVAFSAGINACVIKADETWWWIVGRGEETDAKGECATGEAASEAAGSAAASLAWLTLQEEK